MAYIEFLLLVILGYVGLYIVGNILLGATSKGDGYSAVILKIMIALPVVYYSGEFLIWLFK